MGRIALAFKLFFKTLANASFARRAQSLFDPSAQTARPQPAPTLTDPPQTPAQVRSDAITLLAVLQREARLIDFLKEDISAYQDAQIGAAVRDVHRDASVALERILALRPVLEQPEGSDVTLPTLLDANRLRLIGNLGAQPPSRGKLQHQGWQATKLDLPQYTGTPQTSKVITPAEVEV
jgi:hypothetical protein